MKNVKEIILAIGLVVLGSNVHAQIRMYPKVLDIDTREIVTRLTTEELTEAEKVDLILGPGRSLTLEDRVQYYSQVFGSLPKLQISPSVEITLLRHALGDAEHMPYITSSPNEFPTPVDNLIRTVGRWSADHQTSHAEVAHNFLARIFGMKGITERMLEILSMEFGSPTSDGKSYPDFKFVMENLIQSPLFNETLARSYALELLNTFRPPYLTRSKLLTSVAESGKLTPALSMFAKDLSRKYKASALFFHHLKTVPRNEYYWVNAKQTAFAAIRSQTLYLVGAVHSWLKNGNVPTEIQSEVISELIKNLPPLAIPTENSFPNNVLIELRDTLHFATTEASQKDLIGYFLAQTKTSSSRSESLRDLLAIRLFFNFDSHKNWPLSTTQWATEELVKQTLISATPDDNSGGVQSSVEKVLNALESCQNPNYSGRQADFQQKICQTIISPLAIYQAILNNKNIHIQLRERAEKLKGKL